MSTEKRWYVVSTQGIGSRGVLQIQSLLNRIEYEGMLWTPTVKATITKHGRQQNSDKPLFPSYVFIHTVIENSELEQALIEAKIGRFLRLPGDVLPTPIKEEDIEHIKSLEEANVEPVPEEITVVEIGNLVEVCVGPFMGIKGIVTKVVGHDVYVETLVFGRSAPIRFNMAHLSKLMETYNEKEEN